MNLEARRAALALPIAALLLHWDLIFPQRPIKPIDYKTADLESVYRALPARDCGRSGRAGDPLNMIFLGTEAQVRRVLQSAGWTSLPLSISASVRAGLSDVLQGRPLTHFPGMNDYSVMDRTQDMNWAMVVRPIAERHHFRLWRTGVVDDRGRQLWWGSGNYDLSVRWADLSHRPDPDMDKERDFLAKTLTGVPGVEGVSFKPLAQIPRSGANDKGYEFRSDGRALLVELATDGPRAP